jgi:hypothetical protein
MSRWEGVDDDEAGGGEGADEAEGDEAEVVELRVPSC